MIVTRPLPGSNRCGLRRQPIRTTKSDWHRLSHAGSYKVQELPKPISVSSRDLCPKPRPACSKPFSKSGEKVVEILGCFGCCAASDRRTNHTDCASGGHSGPRSDCLVGDSDRMHLGFGAAAAVGRNRSNRFRLCKHPVDGHARPVVGGPATHAGAFGCGTASLSISASSGGRTPTRCRVESGRRRAKHTSFCQFRRTPSRSSAQRGLHYRALNAGAPRNG